MLATLSLFFFKNNLWEYFQRLETLIQYILKWNLLRFYTDGVENICEAEKDIVEQTLQFVENVRSVKPVIIYCIINGYFMKKYLNG